MTEFLKVTGLTVCYATDDGTAGCAVEGLGFAVGRGELLGILGETGCGKTTAALSVARLLPRSAKIIAGEILFDGLDLVRASEDQMRDVRGKRIGLVFQAPTSSLETRRRVGVQLAETVELLCGCHGREAEGRAVDLLRLVGVAAPEKVMGEFPDRLSSGTRRRAEIALALAARPELLIVDELTTGLDVTVQAQVLELVRELQAEMGFAAVLLTHDPRVLAELVQRVVVMYAGRVVEEADVYALFEAPLHPYTRGLWESIPRMDWGKERLRVMEGTVPGPREMPAGCAFHPRCPEAQEICRREAPELTAAAAGRYVRCWRSSAPDGAG